ncbi:hypothetical protein NA78x_000732 [Anatilimnocola sp. NA78]|uniref:hypothetical protein n=1 Tax=Anatilimnocola sp. NA78 TaxID=3415683 RepID=UPI003CE5A7F7
MREKSWREWQAAWSEAQQGKKPAARREALEVFLKAPLVVVLKLAKKNRKLMQRPVRSFAANVAREYFFAASISKNVLRAVVHVRVWQGRGQSRIEEILICDQVTVGLVPDGYLIRELVHAAAGGIGGQRVVNVSEYLGSCEPDFREDLKQQFPRLRSYQYRGSMVRCAWTTSRLQLRLWQKRLQGNGASLEEALSELEEFLGSLSMTLEVEALVQKALNSAIIPHLTSANPTIQNLAWRTWNTLNHGVRPPGFPPPAPPEWSPPVGKIKPKK